MKKLLAVFLLLLSVSPVFAGDKLSPKWVGELEAARDAAQLVIISGTKGSNADFSFHIRYDDGKWHEIISCPAYIGKKGWGKTREGDMKTPEGLFRFTMAFGINDDPGCMIGYTKVDDTHYWDGDSNSEFYNQFVSTRDYDGFNKKNSEHIIDYKQAYKYCLNINYNEDGVPRRGSAIFLHCQTDNKFTAGCVAIPEEKMRELLTNIGYDCFVIMDTEKRVRKY